MSNDILKELNKAASRSVKQYGLYSTDNDEVENFTKRVMKWNQYHMGDEVKLDILAVNDKEGDKDYPGPHYKLLLEFPNREIQIAFWTGRD